MLCFYACSSDSDYEQEADRGIEMSFDVPSESRAITTSIDEFSVYGDMKLLSGVQDPIVIFNKTTVVNRDGAWCYDGTQYWFPKHEHSFVAVSPSSALESEVSPQYYGSELSFAYTFPTYSDKEMQETQDKSDIIDIVAATHRRSYNEDDKVDVISLRFGHLLSMINFAPKLDDKTIRGDDYIQFHKLEISGLRKKARIAVTPAPLMENPRTDDRLIEFSEYEGNDNLTITFNSSKTVYNGQQINIFANDDAIVMLPQFFEASSEATVRFTYSFKDDPENLRVGTLSLRGQEWKPATAYTYNFTVDKIGLNLVTTTIKKWDSVYISDIIWTVE
ncbi:MAG: fimbrillin family protein [Muribaculaceae bacterium]|nr:fimbrillin family protein [Muribaculaceae bacterium]